MKIERSHLEEVLRQHGSDRTAEEIHQRLPAQVDTERDRPQLSQCGIDANVLEAILAASDT
jgi:hypothetical protein